MILPGKFYHKYGNLSIINEIFIGTYIFLNIQLQCMVFKCIMYSYCVYMILQYLLSCF